ncbi:MAG: DsbA family protein [Gammaproteobacteria bacterium]|nr:DsbA family protein [Gammaproteobacteria bacterium]
MNISKRLPLALMVAALGVSAAHAEPKMPPAQKKQIEQVVHDYLVSNPEVLIEASQALQKKQQETMQTQARTAIAEHGSALVSGSLTVAGNPKGDVTLVEFFDYQCVHCIKMKPVIDALIKKNPNLRVVYKEFPIFGKESELASRVAIVAAKQGKYMAFQDAIFKSGQQHLDEEKVMAIAKKVGLNMETLKADMNTPEVTKLLGESRSLAESIHLMGTPAFVILATPNGKYKAGGEVSFLPGAADEADMQVLINKSAKK